MAKVFDIGLDVGSTTVKLVALDSASGKQVYCDYRRHKASQVQCTLDLLVDFARQFPEGSAHFVVTGSGGSALAQRLDAPFVQEVVANSVALSACCPQVRTAIELGGQDAKIIFFGEDATGAPQVRDMRMNGSCAGGTGAFIDEIAALLGTSAEEFNALAQRGRQVHQVSGRCGVYAKTDIQPLLNRGVHKEDLALSVFHALAKQTIGGLAQGTEIVPPVAFEGGPLTFNPSLVEVFKDRLGLRDDQVVVPDNAQTFVAYGAALCASTKLAESTPLECIDVAIGKLSSRKGSYASHECSGTPLFEDEAELATFKARHKLAPMPHHEPARGEVLSAYLGIDSGSTTTKMVLMTEDGEVVDSFYASNDGEPLKVAAEALAELQQRYARCGAHIDILGVGTTGYGEALFAEAYQADCHVVETVAHAKAALALDSKASFVLDIGGQDMKALWINDGVITNIVVNEACSSGCGSFLEGFSTSLGISVEEIANRAFASKSPAVLGSRCTVFMNSSVVSAQSRGKTPDDIMAGLCSSIIENVFTKVIRLSNLDSLGKHVVVQGGTFANDAVLRSFERYVGHSVTRATYPGLQGALGAAMAAREQRQAASKAFSSFIGFDGVRALKYETQTDQVCPFCQNHCSRTVVRFSSGASFVTGNRCPKGEVLDSASASQVRERLRAVEATKASDLLAERQKLLFATPQVEPVATPRDITIGLPRVLSLWDDAPFWQALLLSLGFKVVLSPESSRELYEGSLARVTSDTVCFPAKLAHGHVKALAQAGVDRIFMPMVTTVPSENQHATSQSRCPVVKGYPMVLRSSDNPTSRFNVPFDTPLFHWFTKSDRAGQLSEYFVREFGFTQQEVLAAIGQAEQVQKAFRRTLKTRAAQVLQQQKLAGKWSVVMASRPYHNDDLVNHGIARLFAEQGIAVIPCDALPGVDSIALSKSRLDIVNNYHARVLESAVAAAGSDDLEFVQLVSFGCGHDAYLSDEAQRLIREAGTGKSPLILKIDESDAEGPLRIRVRSFIETIEMRRTKEKAAFGAHAAQAEMVASLDAVDTASAATPANSGVAIAADAAAFTELSADIVATVATTAALPDPYPVKFTREDRASKVVLVPNTSHAFCRMMTAAFRGQGLIAEPLDVGRDRAIELGKRYVHNDICFPAQIVIGEALAALESGRYDLNNVAIGMAKYVGDCRLTHYSALLRKALDDAGYANVPIITNDDVDERNQHPGFRLSVNSAMRIAFALPMIDILEELLRKMRPYELHSGDAEAAFNTALDALIEGMEKRGIPGLARGFKQGITAMAQVEYDRSQRKPEVLIVGEYLLNYHPGANHDIEAYLERNGMEVIEARMTDVIRKTYFYQHAQSKEYKVDRPFATRAWFTVADNVFECAHSLADSIAKAHPLYTRATRMPELVQASDDIVHHTFDAGEGVLISAEILHQASRGVNNFLILQPFGCLPNHVVGRGIVNSLRERCPNAQILSLDYDPDVSFANVENRLQMMVMNAHAAHEVEGAPAAITPAEVQCQIPADAAVDLVGVTKNSGRQEPFVWDGGSHSYGAA